MKEIEFQKYKTRGADYHWHQVSKKNIFKYNAFVHARYTIVVDQVKKIIDTCHKNTEEKIRIIDMGCGDGVLLYLLSKKIKNPDVELYGVDLSDIAVKTAKNKFEQKGVKNKFFFEAESVYNTSFKDTMFDIIISSDVIEHLNEPDTFIEEIKRLIKPKGFLIIGTPIKYTEKPLDPMHVYEYFPGEFEELLQNYFTAVELFQTCGLLCFLLYGKIYKIWFKKVLPFRYLFNISSLFGFNPFLKRDKYKNESFSYMFCVCQGESKEKKGRWGNDQLQKRW